MSKTNYASLLNNLCEMQESPMYAARKGVLADAENTIRQLEKERDEYKAELRKAREQEPVAYRIDWSDGLVELAWQADGYDEDYVEIRGLPTAVPLGEMPCAAPKPAAPAVPEELVIGVANLIDAFDAENAQLGKNMLAAGVTHASLSDKQAAIYVAVGRLRALLQTTGAKP